MQTPDGVTHRDYVTQGWRHVLPARKIPPGLTLVSEAVRGFDFVAIGSDLGLLMRALQGALASVRGGGAGGASSTTQGAY